MRRHHQLKTWALLQLMYRKAITTPSLPPAFSHAISLMAKHIHPNVFKGAEPLRTVMISEAMGIETTFAGVYFGKLDSTFPKDTTDWQALGWDGIGRFMMFPDDDPQTWVILHEFGHYLEDVFFRKTAGDFMALGYHPSKIKQFVDWKQEAKYEYWKVEADARTLLGDRVEELQKDSHWYEYVPNIILNSAPSRYSLLTFSEWLAENFRRYLIDGPDYVAYRCPDTFKLLEFTLGGGMFHRVAKPEPEATTPGYYYETLAYPAAPRRIATAYTYDGGSHVWDGSEWDEHE